MADPCPVCGVDRVLVGQRHNCRPRPVAVPDVEPVAAEKKIRARAVLDAAVSAAALRQRRWREKNRDKYNATMRTYRAKRKG